MGRPRLRPGRRARVVRAADRGLRRRARASCATACAPRGAARLVARLRRARRRLAVARRRRSRGPWRTRRRLATGSSPRVVRAGVRAVTLVDPDYPARLRRIELPPPVLYVRARRARSTVPRPSPSSARGGRRPSGVRRAAAHRRRDRRPRRDRGLGPRARDRRGGPRGDAPRRRHHRRGHRRRARSALSGLSPRAGPGDRGRGRSGHQRVRAGHGADRGARSRGGTGSSAASRMPRSSSRPACGAAR